MRYVGKKLLQLVGVLFAVSVLTFLLLNLLPGGPETAILGPSATEEARAQLREELGLDRPVPVRYADWVTDALTGDLGKSYVTKQPVSEAIRERLPTSIQLMLLAQIFALGAAIPLGILAARRAGGWFDRTSTTTAFGLLSIPNFVLGIMLIYVFAVQLDVFPAIYRSDDKWRSLVLPAVTLAVAEAAVYLRLLRTDMVATLQEDYIMMAKSKGIPDRRILLHHAFRPSTFTLVTVAGLNIGRLVGGALVVEVLFAIPGVGRLVVESIGKRDYLMVQGSVLVIASAYVIVNFLVDLLYGVLDPRIRHARALT